MAFGTRFWEGLPVILLTLPLLAIEAQSQVFLHGEQPDHLEHPMEIRHDRGADNGRYLATGSKRRGEATYTFNVGVTGDYRVEALVRSPASDANSFFMAIDGATPKAWHLPVSRDFTWQSYGVARLSAGQHEIFVGGREPDTDLDALQVVPLGAALTDPPPPSTPVPGGVATIFVSPQGDDRNSGTVVDRPLATVQAAMNRATAGDRIEMAPGVYAQDIRSVRSGTASDPITLSGPREAVVVGGGSSRIIEIRHNDIVLEGFSVDGLHGDANHPDGYRDKLIYVYGAPGAGLARVRILNMDLCNAGGECVRFRYFAQDGEIAHNAIQRCGVHDFLFGGGGKNGQGIYIGTDPDDWRRNPSAEPDASDGNWIHHNFVDTQGSACVVVREGASNNVIELNRCEGQRDSNAGGINLRGSFNTVSQNTIANGEGVGIRLGGDAATDGTHNDIHSNQLTGNQMGGLKVMRAPQAGICENQLRGNGGLPVIGSEASGINPEAPCGNGVVEKSPETQPLPDIVADPTPRTPPGGSGTQYYVATSGSDTNSGTSASQPLETIQAALAFAQPGDTVNLAAGDYFQDVVSVRSGTSGNPITITGPSTAIVRGAGNDRMVEINHSYLTLQGFTLDGLHGNPNSENGYRDKLLYVIGETAGVGVSNLRVLQMTFQNGGGECIRMKYFAQQNEIAYSTFVACGVYDYVFNAGGKNGEGIYLGTAPEQLYKNPTSDPDQSSDNWIHNNVFDTQGNECVDIKEASLRNIVEYNDCTGQRDPNSGCVGARGSENIFRFNTLHGCDGAGIRVGGDNSNQGLDNEMYGNDISDTRYGLKIMRVPQGALVCDNNMTNITEELIHGPGKGIYDPNAVCP